MIKALVCVIAAYIGVHLNSFTCEASTENKSEPSGMIFAKDIFINASALNPHTMSSRPNHRYCLLEILAPQALRAYHGSARTNLRPVSLHDFWMRPRIRAGVRAKEALPHYSRIARWGQPGIKNVSLDHDPGLGLEKIKTGLSCDEVSAKLPFSNIAGDADCVYGCFSGPSRQKDSDYEHDRTSADKPSLNVGVITHFLRSAIHGPRCFVHSLLGEQVINLALAGFGFLALAGLGLGLILGNFDHKRCWDYYGWGLFSSGLPVGFWRLLLGLP